MDAGRYGQILRKNVGTEYINWFHNVCKNKGYVYITNHSELDEEDKGKIKGIEALYYKICEYATKRNIKPYFGSYETFREQVYNIKLNDFCFSIGMIYNESRSSYYNKIFISSTILGDPDSFIDFSDVQKRKSYI